MVLLFVVASCLFFYFAAAVIISRKASASASVDVNAIVTAGGATAAVAEQHNAGSHEQKIKNEFIRGIQKEEEVDIPVIQSPKAEIGSDTRTTTTTTKEVSKNENSSNGKIEAGIPSPTEYKLSAFIEPIDQEDWKIKPLPARTTTAADLEKMDFEKVNSCSRLPEQWPTSEEDSPTNKDPFLPWIHDVFPSADGKYIQFIAQNKRRCQTGKMMAKVKKFMQPNIALFQHVPIKRIKAGNDGDKNDGGDESSSTQYRLASHEEADSDGVETRFICRFKPSMEETLSVHNLNYDYHTMRKQYKATFTEEGFDNHMIWSSQLIFKCPVPESLQESVRLGKTVVNDYATQFVDLIPIRTPPRYGKPTEYLPPRLFKDNNTWKPDEEWGKSHILPSIENSGRWENIPICKPSLMQYPDEAVVEDVVKHDASMAELARKNEKKNKLIACTWTSSSFKTRGGRTEVSDGDTRLLQWLEFNKMVGVDHVYIYDNSGAFSDTASLKPITDRFPDFVTRINWPAKVCNNNKGNGDNKGERSSQYAATMDCHLRFGAHSDWLASYDTDEYMTPVGEYNDLKELLAQKEKEDIKVLNWKSKRSRPRHQYFDRTISDGCNNRKACFNPALPKDKTFLEVYNCNIEKPERKNTMPAEKAIYRTDYVILFFVHYATITTRSQMGKPETEAKGRRFLTRYRPQTHTRFTNEETEGTMLHSKAVVQKETIQWMNTGKVGIEWPRGKDSTTDEDFKVQVDGAGYTPNCFPVEKIDDYWVPKLEEALQISKS